LKEIAQVLWLEADASRKLKNAVVIIWTIAFALAVASLFLYRNVKFGGRYLLLPEQVVSYAISILHIFAGPVLSMIFYNLGHKIIGLTSIQREYAVLALGVTLLMAGASTFQFYAPLFSMLDDQRTIVERLSKVDWILSITNCILVLPLNLIVFSSEIAGKDR
jgi:hypothetical protein